MKVFYLLIKYFSDLSQKTRTNQNFSSILSICFYLQIMSVIIQPHYLEVSEINGRLNIFNIFGWISQIGRPYQFFLQNSEFRKFSFLIPSFFIISLMTGAIISLIEQFKENQKDKNRFINHQQKIFENFQQILSNTIQISYFVLNLYFMDLFSISMLEVINSVSINFTLLILISTFYILLILFILINFYCQETLQFPCSPLQFESFSFSDIFVIFITCLSLFFSNLHENWQLIILQIMNFVILSFHVKNEIYRISVDCNTFAILLLSSSYSYCISEIIFLFINDKTIEIVTIFILIPFVMNNILNLKQYNCRINLLPKRNIQKIYNNLIIIFHLTSQNKDNFSLNALKQTLSRNTNQEVFLLELQQLNEKIIVCEKNEQYYWNKKYIIIKRSLNKITDALSLIENMKNNLIYVESQQKLIKIQFYVPQVQKIQIEQIKVQALKQLYSNIVKTDGLEILEISAFVTQQMQSNNIIQSMQRLFLDKQRLYLIFLKSSPEEERPSFQILYNLTKNALNLQVQISNQLQQYKTYMLQQLLIILNIEFFNNALQAELVKYSQTISEVKQNVFEKIEYLIVSLNNDVMNLTITYYSQKFIDQIGYKYQPMSKNFDILQLLPEDFKEIHQQLVLNFLQTGKCKFYNNKALVFVRGAENCFYQVEFQIYPQPNIKNELQFYLFIQILETQPSVLLVNKNSQILGYTQPLIKVFQQLNLPNLHFLQMQNINQTFLNFKRLKIDHEKKNYGLVVAHLDEVISASIFLSNNIYYLFFSDHFVENTSEFSTYKIKKITIPSINTESIVEIPKILYESLNSPISLEITKRNAQDTNKFIVRKSVSYKKSFSKSKSESNKNSGIEKGVTLHNHGDQKHKEDNFDNDKASSKYSRGVLENSLFNQKYGKLNDFLNQENKSSYSNLAIITLLLGILINFIYQFVNILDSLQKFERAKADSDILAIKSYFITPIHDCVTAQICTVSYMLLSKLFMQIPVDVAYEKTQFSLDAINQSYYWLKSSFQTELNNENLEGFYYNTNISIQQIVNQSLVMRNISLKNALYYYLEAQYYISTLNYYEVLKVVTSNDFVYYMSNIIRIDDYFDELNENTKNFVLARIDVISQDLTKLILKFGMLELISIMVAFSYILKHYHTNKVYFKLLTDMNIIAVQKELQKIEQILIILQNESASKDYNYELNERERLIKSFEMSYNLKINQKRLSSSLYHQSKISLYVIFCGLLLILLIPQFIMQSINDTFCAKYKASSQLLTTLSLTSSAITAIYEIREINYMINEGLPFFYFFTDEKRLEQNVKVVQSLDQLKSFMSIFPEINEDELLIDDNFKTVYNDIKQSSLCNYIIHFSAALAQEFCQSIYSGVMELGLYNTINEIYSQITTEYQMTNGFEAKLRNKLAVYEEAELGLITSDAVLYIQGELFNGILNQKDVIVSIHKITSAMFIIIDVILIVILLFYMQPYYKTQHQIVKQMIHIVPSYQFYLDKTFETNFRYFQLQQF